MGSSQSVQQQPPPPSNQNSKIEWSSGDIATTNSSATTAATTTTTTTTTTTKKQLTKDGSLVVVGGIALIEYKCRKKKRAWGRCVKEHYEHKFLSGKSIEPAEADCDELFERYRQCYMRGMLKQRQGDNGSVALPKEGTLLHEFMEEEGMLDSNSDSGRGSDQK
jgi:hypothetical protein